MMSSANQVHRTSWFALWLPIDLFLKDATLVDLPGVDDTLVKVLQAINGTIWHNIFLGL